MIITFKIRFCIANILLLAMMGWAAGATASDAVQPAFLDPETITWRNLTFRARSFLGNVDTNVSITITSADSVAPDFIAVPGNRAVQAAGPVVLATRIKTRIKPLVGFDEVLTTRAWIDCGTAAALQRIRLREGKEKWQKIYRYTDAGVFRIRKKPKDADEVNQPPLKWTKVREAFYAYPTNGQECTTILEPGSLLLVATLMSQIQQNHPLQLCVFNKKQLHRVKASVNGQQQLKLKYEEKNGNDQTPRENRIDAAKISFYPTTPRNANETPEEFSFLGLKGQFDIFVDRISGLPVQISGRVAAFGKLHLRLQAVEYARRLNHRQ